MQSILVLTDFSNAAFAAAKYAAMLSKVAKSKNLLLFHAYQNTPAVINEPVLENSRENLHAESLQLIEIWQESIKQLTHSSTRINFLVDDVDLVEGTNTLCAEEKIDLVVVGITGKSNLEKVLIGSNAIRLMEGINYPLLIVPSHARDEAPERVVLATDLMDVKEKLSNIALLNLLDTLQGKLLVVNTAQQEKDIATLRMEIQDLHLSLDRYNPKFHYIQHRDTVAAIDNFAKEKQVDIIITLHKQHSGLAAIFHKSVSKKLAWHSEVPLLVLPV